MISEVINSQLFEIQCIGCDAAFKSDHPFLDSLADNIYYFASIRENENLFREMPQVVTPENRSGAGGRYKHPRSVEQPVAIKTIVDDESVPRVKRVISEGTKGCIHADVKCLRCVSSRKENHFFVPQSEI